MPAGCTMRRGWRRAMLHCRLSACEGGWASRPEDLACRWNGGEAAARSIVAGTMIVAALPQRSATLFVFGAKDIPAMDKPRRTAVEAGGLVGAVRLSIQLLVHAAASPRAFGHGLAAFLLTLGLGTGPGAVAATAPTVKADRVLVIKHERRLYLMRGGQVLRSYHVALGREPRGAKLHAGDGRTPEGAYLLDGRNKNSRFYRSMHVSYPSPDDRRRAREQGLAVGGGIMLHGLPLERPNWGEEHWRYNWTNGCIAVTDAEMDEIWQRVEVGTPIEIRP